jgi:hypothetical protein
MGAAHPARRHPLRLLFAAHELAGVVSGFVMGAGMVTVPPILG